MPKSTNMRRVTVLALASCMLLLHERPAIAQSSSAFEQVSLTSVHHYVAGEAIPRQLAPPPNLVVSAMYRPLVEAMLRDSPTFRRQCVRIAAEPGAHGSSRRQPAAAPLRPPRDDARDARCERPSHRSRRHRAVRGHPGTDRARVRAHHRTARRRRIWRRAPRCRTQVSRRLATATRPSKRRAHNAWASRSCPSCGDEGRSHCAGARHDADRRTARCAPLDVRRVHQRQSARTGASSPLRHIRSSLAPTPNNSTDVYVLDRVTPARDAGKRRHRALHGRAAPSRHQRRRPVRRLRTRQRRHAPRPHEKA